MPITYLVHEGDCISSIAFKYGLLPDTIWEDPNNRKLKELRKDPNVLLPGDVVIVKEKALKEVSGAAEQRHRFRRKAVPEHLRVQLLDQGEPRGDVAFDIVIDGHYTSGRTDRDGFVDIPIPPNAKEGILTLEGGEEIELDLGYLDPVDAQSGVLERLVNLGYLDDDDPDADDIATAIEDFQVTHDLPVTGEADEPTLDKLKEVHGS